MALAAVFEGYVQNTPKLISVEMPGKPIALLVFKVAVYTGRGSSRKKQSFSIKMWKDDATRCFGQFKRSDIVEVTATQIIAEPWLSTDGEPKARIVATATDAKFIKHAEPFHDDEEVPSK